MSDEFSKRVAALSDEKRELLELFLKSKRVDAEWLHESYVAPRTPIEEALVEIWQEVLGVERVGIEDNFFELGGDSILSIQIIAKANQAGLTLSSNLDLFERPTIGELAPLVTASGEAAATAEASGPLFLLPAQRRMLEAGGAPDAPILLLELPPDVDAGLLAALPARLAARHDALRLRFERQGSDWRPRRIPPEEATPPIAEHDLEAMPETDPAAALAAVASRLWEAIEPTRGPLFGLALVTCGAEPARLLAAFHPLVADPASLSLLAAELAAAVEAVASGNDLEQPGSTVSFQRWTQRLAEHAASPELAAEADTWRAVLAEDSAGLSVLGEASGGGDGDGGRAETVRRLLDEASTRALLKEIPAAHRLRVTDLLLTAVVEEATAGDDRRCLTLDLEGTGRQGLAGAPDLSAAVGCFSAVYPVHLDLAGANSPMAAIKAVKQSLQEVPAGGVGYGLLRAAGALDDSDEHRLLLGYRGRRPRSVDAPGETPGAAAGGRPLQVISEIVDDRLELAWTFDPSRIEGAALERLAARVAERLESLVEQALAGGDHGLTAADFPQAEMAEGDLEVLLSQDG